MGCYSLSLTLTNLIFYIFLVVVYLLKIGKNKNSPIACFLHRATVYAGRMYCLCVGLLCGEQGLLYSDRRDRWSEMHDGIL